MKRPFCYDPTNPHREKVLANLCEYIRSLGTKAEITVGEATRTLEQNDRMWALLTDISKQVQWPVDGKMQFLSTEDWKHILTAGLKHEQRVAQGINGGFVIMGQSTSRMSIRALSELMTLIEAFGSERGVAWSEPKREVA